MANIWDDTLHYTTVIWRPFAITEGWQQLSWHSERARPWTQRSQQPKPWARQEALAHGTAVNQMSSPLRRPDAIYFSFSSHCWHTVIAGPCCLATKSRQTFSQSSVGGEAPPLSVPGGMIERSLYSPPCLTAHRLSFLKTLKGECMLEERGPFTVGTKHSVMSSVRTLNALFFTLNN